MTIFERAEAQSVNAMAGGKNQKKRRRPGAKNGMYKQRKWDAPSTSGPTKNGTHKTIRKERGNFGKPN